MTSPSSPIRRKLSAFGPLGDDEVDILRRFQRHRRGYPPKHELTHEGQANPTAFLLIKGWACSFKLLPTGERQIIDFHIPGDFMGLRSILLRRADHSIESLTHIEVSEVLAAELLHGFRQVPRLAAAVLWAAARDEAILAEHLVNLGRRSAEQRVVHFLLELGARVKLVGLGDVTKFDCPLTQFHLADALGLSPVHVNRVLRQLRELGLVTFRKGQVSLGCTDRLRELAGSDFGYLDHETPILAGVDARFGPP
ncbi:MAG: Crp/Fnr family transcriptional regulator [Paracoccaceae bacterium]